MGKMELIKYNVGKLQKVSNGISIMNKLLKKNAEEYFESAIEKGKLGEFEEAISDYTKAIELDPNFTLALAHKYTLMGMRYYSEDNFEDAKACFIETTKLIDELYSYFQLISLYLKTEDVDSALCYLGIAISKFPETSNLYLIRGKIKSQFLEMPYDAINDFTKAMEIETKSESYTEVLHEACYERAKIKVEIGDQEGGKRDHIIAKSFKTGWRIKHEGLNEEEKKIFKSLI